MLYIVGIETGIMSIILTNLWKKAILWPNEDQSSYHMICGEYGTGKTTLIRISAKEVGQGVIYVDIPTAAEDFGKAFGKVLNFAFEKHISYINNYKFEHPKWKRVMEAFKRSAEVYKKKYSKPPVIIYDNICQLAYKNPEIIDILQDDARTMLIIKNILLYLLAVCLEECIRSSCSHVSTPVMEIGDLRSKNKKDDKNEKGKFYEIDEEEQNAIYEFVGGSIFNLKDVTKKYMAGEFPDNIKQQMLLKAKQKFEKEQFLSGDKLLLVICGIQRD
ncbi:hypothetical protein C1645_836465 [Glomus cerebriforme]|uniref:ATPase AAA-type core domain-containing protein n=1 Tax=Glomus cerebriforme TaxID=658196 RepID=A0A397S5U6_9GLOM|nr:hypothetical protein C1645_836465 [Glomus cerebriforme]